MKNLKKLSVVFMLTALFSTSFISCIDNSVSDSVDSIYEAQGELIAAQAAVLNAEAELRLAKALVEEANAAHRLAQAANIDALTEGLEIKNAFDQAKYEQDLRRIIANADTAVRVAEIALETAELNFQKEMERIIAEIEAAGVQRAVEYAYAYAAAMDVATGIQASISNKENDLAVLNLMTSPNGQVSWEFHLARMNQDLAALQAEKAAKIVEIAALEAYLADPSTPEATTQALKDENAALRAENDDLDLDIAVIRNEIDVKYKEWFDGDELIAEVDFIKGTITDLEDEISDLEEESAEAEDDIIELTAIIADYDGQTAILEQAVADAEERVGSNADSTNDHANNHPDPHGLLGDIQAKEEEKSDLEDDLGTYGAAPMIGDSPRDNDPNTAQDELWNADLALLEHNAELDLLVASYNAAAAALALAPDPQLAQDALDAAILAETAASDALAVAQAKYADAQTAFEADPTGSVDEDLTFAEAVVVNPGTLIDDFGQIGITGDGNNNTYMKVNSVDFGNLITPDDNTPNGAFPEQFTEAQMVSDVATMIALNGQPVDPAYIIDGPGGNYDMTLVTDFWVLKQDGNLYYSNDLVTPIPGSPFSTIPDAVVQDGFSTVGNVDVKGIMYVEVEADDSSVPTVNTFNIATNELGTDDFASREIIGDITDPDYNAPLVLADDHASYDSTWDGTGVMPTPGDMLTAQAVLWNAQLDVAVAQFAVDNPGTAQEVYDAQKLLFDEGIATQTALQGDVDAAQGVVDGLGDDIDDVQDEIDALNAELGSNDYAHRDYATKLMLSWDEHANDGIPVGEEVYKYRADAGWDSTDDGDADMNTAYAELWNAEKALFEHTAKSLSDYEEELADAMEVVAENALMIPELEILLAKAEEELALRQAEYDELMNTPLNAQQFVDILELWQEIWALEDQQAANRFMINANRNIIAAIWGNLASHEDLSDIEDDIAACVLAVKQLDLAIEQKMVDIDRAEVREEDVLRDIADCEAEIAALQGRLENTLAIAARFKELMDAELAS